MKMKLIALFAVLGIFPVSLFAQNNPVSSNTDITLLKQLIRQHKNIHLELSHDALHPVTFYEVPASQKQKPVAAAATTSRAANNNFHLVKDINAQTDANPVNSDYANDQPYAILNNVLYFSANDGIHGTQLWRSNGTAAGTYMVYNIEPAAASINEITTAGNKIFFVAQDANRSVFNLYASDGTAAGTGIIKDLVYGGSGINGAYYLTAVNNTLYFFTNYNYAPQLWKTDGTVIGTNQVKDFTSIAQQPYLTAASNGLFYFTIYTTNNGRELWRSNGTDNGTFMVKDISASTDFFEGPLQLTPYINKLYFSADDGTGRKLWFTDGTAAGTSAAPGNNGVILPDDFLLTIFNTPFTVAGNNLYAAASTPATGTEVYKYTPAEGFAIIKDITPGAQGGYIESMLPVLNGVVFSYIDTADKTNRLYATTGNAGSAFLIKLYNNYAAGFYKLALAGSTVYAVSNGNNEGNELWKIDVQQRDFIQVKDIYEGATSSNPQSITPLKGELFFSAASKNSGTELWQSAGSEAGTTMVKEINSTSTSSSAANYNSYFGSFVASLNNTLYFSATKPETGYELYSSGGTAASTQLTKDILEGEYGSNPQNFISRYNNVYFLSSDGMFGIYKVDSSGTVSNLSSSSSYIYSYDVAANGLVFFIKANYLTSKQELWRTDGTAAGSYMLTDKVFSTQYANIVVTAGNTAYFSAMDNNGVELWKSDGTINGTGIVKDIAAGAGSSSPYSLYSFNNQIYFGADDGSGIALWKSNGKAAGTIKLKNIQPYQNYGDYFNYFCAVNNRLYLNASSTKTGAELWATNGTPNGTVLVKDIVPGSENSNPAFLTNVNGTLFFSASYNGLYKSDGTEAGTVLIKYIPVQNYNFFTERCTAAGKFFFNPDNMLWVSDGTDAGTYQVQDYGITGVIGVQNMAAANNNVFFDGYTNQYGSELYAGDASKMIMAVAVHPVQKIYESTFTASVLQNPVQGMLNLKINAFSNQLLYIVISNERGDVIMQKNLSVNKGKSNVTIPASNWQTGVYAVKIISNLGTAASITILK